MKPECRAKLLALAARTVSSELQVLGPYNTAITRLEVLSGFRTGKQETSVKRMLMALKTLPRDVAAAVRAAEVRRTLEKKGVPIDMADRLIAGIAVLQGERLTARNLRHFERVPVLLPVDIS